MIDTGLGGDSDFGAEERRPQLGDQFLHGVGLRTEAAREIAGATVRMSSPVRQLMEGHTVIGILRHEGRRQRQADVIVIL